MPRFDFISLHAEQVAAGRPSLSAVAPAVTALLIAPGVRGEMLRRPRVNVQCGDALNQCVFGGKTQHADQEMLHFAVGQFGRRKRHMSAAAVGQLGKARYIVGLIESDRGVHLSPFSRAA